jgi:hypothetical protein
VGGVSSGPAKDSLLSSHPFSACVRVRGRMERERESACVCVSSLTLRLASFLSRILKEEARRCCKCACILSLCCCADSCNSRTASQRSG